MNGARVQLCRDGRGCSPSLQWKRASPMAHPVESLFNHSVRLVGFQVAGVSAG